MLQGFIKQLGQKMALSDQDVAQAVADLVNEAISPVAKADFLCALAEKGETVPEIAAFASHLRAKSLSPPLFPSPIVGELLDVCGTGGDHLNTFNISTSVALVVAAAGVHVAKHGNRAITSRSGSADVLEALGIRIDLTPEEAVRSLCEHHFAFFFAQKYHPLFKHIAPARKLCAERGRRTIFNFLGPLLNPVKPTAQLIGVPRPDLCQPMAEVLRSLGVRHGLVVSGVVGASYLDELSTLGANTLAYYSPLQELAVSVRGVEGWPLQPVVLKDLEGGTPQENAIIIRKIFEGKDRGPKRDAVSLNAAAALWVAGKVSSVEQGWSMATDILDGGGALSKLERLAAS